MSIKTTYRERQSDSMSLSEKYGASLYETDRQSDRRSQEPSTTDWDTR